MYASANNGKEVKDSAIVVGGSLSGLMTAISLAEEKISVIVLEKTVEGSRTGAGLQVDASSFYQSKTEKRLRKLASGGKSRVELWASIEARLRKAAHAEELIDLCFETEVIEIGQNDDKAWARTRSQGNFTADILIGADGHRSLVREIVAPEKPNADFAGYTVWMASIAKDELAPRSQPKATRGKVKMINSPDGFLFGSVMEDSEGETRIGSTWYDNSQSELLYQLGAVKDGVVQFTIDGKDLHDKVIERLVQKTEANWPEPWCTVTKHAIRSRNFIGTPIKEYYPKRLVKDRIALVGDAAHVPAPITASGFNDSILDAVVLGECVRVGIHESDALKALKRYEDKRLKKVQQMVQSGKSFSANFGRY